MGQRQDCQPPRIPLHHEHEAIDAFTFLRARLYTIIRSAALDTWTNNQFQSPAQLDNDRDSSLLLLSPLHSLLASNMSYLEPRLSMTDDELSFTPGPLSSLFSDRSVANSQVYLYHASFLSTSHNDSEARLPSALLVPHSPPSKPFSVRLLQSPYRIICMRHRYPLSSVPSCSFSVLYPAATLFKISAVLI
ncbi:hypothetical protein BJ165DRAFT_1535030 [Panaeolus papilionaceus]|nr:hypothetical protein BJ165DRAFT_1535030 [Panaeolus papilionaceus]